MKLLVLADLHLDQYLRQKIDPFAHIEAKAFDEITHCVLAGDLSNKGHKFWKQALPWLNTRLNNAQLYVMPGNHDYYGGAIDKEEKLRAAAEENGATFLQKSSIVINRHRLLCATLWTDFAIYGDRANNIRHAAAHMNDYHAIRVAAEKYRKLSPNKTAQLHYDHVRWLGRELSTPFDGETTVISHHAPHLQALKGEPAIGPCYASNLDALIRQYQPSRWLYGHTHFPVRFHVGKTEVANVSIGYPQQHDPLTSLDRFVFSLKDAP